MSKEDCQLVRKDMDVNEHDTIQMYNYAKLKQRNSAPIGDMQLLRHALIKEFEKGSDDFVFVFIF
jgi:hypothetical protein